MMMMKTGCNGKRPCNNCLKKHRQCFEPEKDNPSTSRSQKRNARKKTQQLNENNNNNTSELQELQNRLTQVQQELDQTKTQNKQLADTIQQRQQGIVKAYTRNEFCIDLFDSNYIPQELSKAIVIWECTSFRLVGCNALFRQFTNLSLKYLRTMNATFIDCIPQEAKEMSIPILHWFVSSTVKKVTVTHLLQFGSQKHLVKGTNYLEKSFVWLELEPRDELDDGIQVDDVKLEPTYTKKQQLANTSTTSHQDLFYTRLFETMISVHSCSNNNSQRMMMNEQQQQQQPDLFYSMLKLL
jgi:hypothetical protein